MKSTLYITLQEAVEDYYATKQSEILLWISKWPGQHIISTMHIALNNNMNRVFSTLPGDKEVTLQSLHEDILREIESLSRLVKQKVDDNSRCTVYNMIINRVHARDSLTQMLGDSVEEAENFYWRIEMKYHYVWHGRKRSAGRPEPESAE